MRAAIPPLPLAELTDHLDSTVGEIVVVRLLVDGVVVREDILDDKVVERPMSAPSPAQPGSRASDGAYMSRPHSDCTRSDAAPSSALDRTVPAARSQTLEG